MTDRIDHRDRLDAKGILKHGGEWHADDADEFLLELTKEKE